MSQVSISGRAINGQQAAIPSELSIQQSLSTTPGILCGQVTVERVGHLGALTKRNMPLRSSRSRSPSPGSASLAVTSPTPAAQRWPPCSQCLIYLGLKHSPADRLFHDPKMRRYLRNRRVTAADESDRVPLKLFLMTHRHSDILPTGGETRAKSVKSHDSNSIESDPGIQGPPASLVARADRKVFL